MRARDVWLALGLCLTIVVIGTVVVLIPQNGDVDALRSSLALVSQRIADDQVYISKYPAQEKSERHKMAVLTGLDITAGGTEVERRFLMGYDTLIRRNRVGVRPMTIGAAFAEAAAKSTPSTSGTPAPAPSPNSLPSPDGGATAAPAATTAPAGAGAPGGFPTMANGNPSMTAGNPLLAGARVPLPGPVAKPVLQSNSGSLEIVGSYSSVLRAISQLSAIPVLFQVQSATLTRDTNKSSRDPQIDAKIAFTLYRVEDAAR